MLVPSWVLYLGRGLDTRRSSEPMTSPLASPKPKVYDVTTLVLDIDERETSISCLLHTPADIPANLGHSCPEKSGSLGRCVEVPSAPLPPIETGASPPGGLGGRLQGARLELQ